MRDKQSASSIDLEPDINLEREFDGVRKKRYLEQQCRASRGRHKEDIKQEMHRKRMYRKKVYGKNRSAIISISKSATLFK